VLSSIPQAIRVCVEWPPGAFAKRAKMGPGAGLAPAKIWPHDSFVGHQTDSGDGRRLSFDPEQARDIDTSEITRVSTEISREPRRKTSDHASTAAPVISVWKRVAGMEMDFPEQSPTVSALVRSPHLTGLVSAFKCLFNNFHRCHCPPPTRPF